MLERDDRLAKKDAELVAERERRPILLPSIKEAYVAFTIATPPSHLVLMSVRVENAGSDPARISRVEARATWHGQTYGATPFESPPGLVAFAIHSRASPVPNNESDRLEMQPPAAGRDRVEGWHAAMFQHLPFKKFSDVVLGVRVQGVGCAWTDWVEFQPPEGVI